MNSLLFLLFFVLLTIPVASRLRRDGNQKIIYLWPWKWLVEKIVELSARARWDVYADVAITFAVGPVLAWRFIKHRKPALLSFFGYLLTIFAIVPALGGTTIFGQSIFGAAFISLFGFGGYALFLVGLTAYGIILDYITGGQPSPGIAPALPGVRIGGIYIPLVEGVVALIIALIVHEGAHGVVAIRERIPVKAGGIITLGLLPIGAYVEPDETLFRQAGRLSRARVLAAGPMANLVVFFLFTALLLLAFPVSEHLSAYACTSSSGVRILDVPKTLDVGGNVIDSPAHGILMPGDVVLEINGSPVNCVSEFFEVLSPVRDAKANVPLDLLILRGGEELNVSIHTEKGYIGIVGVENVYESALPLWYQALAFIISLLSWIAFLNFMVGLVNMLPLPPLDGGHLYRDLLEEAGMLPAYRILLWLTIAILVINVLPWFV